MGDSSVKLKDILNSIDNNTLILPDFQRDYVWIKEDDKIEEFITSVLSQLPIGSIIKFKDNFKSFANKEIGFNKTITFSEDFGKVEFLLDGQQRITTLSLVFSDRIFSKIKLKPSIYKPDDLVQKDNIKKRYFLVLPLYNDDIFKNDFFGFEHLNFPFSDPDKITFCSNELNELIHTENFTFASNDPKRGEWYYPTAESYTNPKLLNKTIEGAIATGWIPLYLLTDNDKVIKRILSTMADRRKEYLKDIYQISKIDEVKAYIENNPEIYSIDLSQSDDVIYNEFIYILENNNWADNMHAYLTSCLKQLRINTIDVDDENTSRAINMYEALNKGGAKLTTYDLIIARASKEGQYGKKGYAQINKDIISEYYNSDIFKIVAKGSGLSSWNSKDYLKTITRNGEIVSVVINQFLNLLCFVANNSTNDKKMKVEEMHKISNEYCKAKKHLELTSTQIVSYSSLVMKSLMDALMVLQFKCGIFHISQIDYNLLLLPLSYIMYLYESETVSKERLEELINKFCGVYYYCIFTGEYQSDQSTIVMKHLEWVHNWILSSICPLPFEEQNQEDYIDKKVLNRDKYNDLATLLYKNDSSPKKSVRNSILHFVLAGKPSDFIQNTPYSKLNAWTEKLEFEIHHITPLASATSIKESTKELRDQAIMMNSPLNMALISKEANRSIANYQISQYLSMLDTTFLNKYGLSPDIKTLFYDKSKDDDLEKILTYRYDILQSNIITKIKEFINE